MPKEKQGKRLPDFVLVRYYRHVGLAGHLSRAGLPSSYVQQNSMWTVLGVGQDSRFKKADYIGLSLGEIIGGERGPRGREAREKPEKAGKPVKKNGKKPPLKVKNAKGEIVEVA
jgi:hypothetical protein